MHFSHIATLRQEQIILFPLQITIFNHLQSTVTWSSIMSYVTFSNNIVKKESLRWLDLSSTSHASADMDQ